MAEHSNRLIHESSPYLRQHAHNPVDWYPWGEEALEKARREDKPILLSIGYSACHWCHVMEHESFEDEETARLMNDWFVNIKVDREERPDIDHIYMTAVQMLIGRGGWPLTVFLLPDGRPFYGGTYFPNEPRHGMPAFRTLLRAVVEAYRERPDDVQRTVGQIMEGFTRAEAHDPSDRLPEPGFVREAAGRLASAYDSEHGGIGQAPKFPNAGVLDVFLRVHQASGAERWRDMVLHTLRRMARGGIYDQLGGGFHRYSVDARWLVPHFEKMLYDNAQLVPLYLAAFQITEDLAFATTARETLDWVMREMRDPEGGFYSTLDADSEGEEGKFYVWSESELRSVLGDELAEIAGRYWDVSEAGNFEGKNILHPTLDVEQLGRLYDRDPADLRLLLGEVRAKLFAARSRRVRPGRDEKMLTSWNALMISAFARAAQIFGEEADRRAALDGAAFVQRRLQRGDRLLSVFKDGEARLNGHLDDYSFFVVALLDLFEAVQDRVLLNAAIELTESMLRHFWDDHEGGFFFTSDDHEELIVRSKPSFDGSVPSGNSMAVQALLRLHHYTGSSTFRARAEDTLRLFARAMEQQPFAFAHMLCGLDFLSRPPVEIVLVGEPDEASDMLLEQIHRVYLPNRTVLRVPPGDDENRPPPARGKTQVDGRPTVYVCRDMACSAPVTTWPELEPLLRRDGE